MDFELADRSNNNGHNTGSNSGGGAAAPVLLRPPPPPPPPPSSALPSGVTPRLSSSNYNLIPTATTTSSVVRPSITLDDLADEFLSGPRMGVVTTATTSGKTTEEPVVLLGPDPLPADASDLERLRILVSRRAWSDVLLYTNQLRTGNSSHYAPLYRALLAGPPSSSGGTMDLALDSHQQDIVYILMVHIEALVKLGNFKELAYEISRWTFCHHIQRQNMSTPSDSSDEAAPVSASHTTTTGIKLNAWIPWSLHIVAALTLQYGDGTDTAGSQNSSSSSSSSNRTNNSNVTMQRQLQCVDALWAIRSDIQKDNVADLAYVENALHNVFIAMKDWRMALQCLQRILDDHIPALSKLDAQHGTSSNGTTAESLSAAYRCECLSRQGRILLQAGAIDAATLIFHQAAEIWKSQHADGGASSSSDDDKATMSSSQQLHDNDAGQQLLLVPAQLASNDGLLKFSYGKYDEALECFRTTIQHLRSYKFQERPISGFHAQVGSGSLWGFNASTTSTRFLGSISTTLYHETMNNMALCALYTCRLPQAIQLMESLIREDVTANLTDRVALNLCTMYELASDTAISARKKRVLQMVARRFQLHDIKPESFRVA